MKISHKQGEATNNLGMPIALNYYSFYCPGCKRGHTVGDAWGFNGDFEKPTFKNHSIALGHPSNPDYCHSHIRDGFIQFVNDSKHELSGQTVELPHFPENYGV